jgi:hypothetical protein
MSVMTVFAFIGPDDSYNKKCGSKDNISNILRGMTKFYLSRISSAA